MIAYLILAGAITIAAYSWVRFARTPKSRR